MRAATLIRMAVILGVVVTLEAICRFGLVKPALLQPPSVMATTLVAMMGTSGFWRQVGASGSAVLIALVSSVAVGCVLAVILHALPRVRSALEPFIASYYALPIFVLYPLLVVLLGINQWPIILIGFLYGVVSVMVGTLTGLDRIPQVLRRTGRVHHLSRLRQAWFISIPAAAPYVFTGGKLALSYAITGVLGSEFILADSGFGYELSYAYNNFDDRRMYALLLFLTLVISLLVALIHAAEQSIRYRAGSAKRVTEAAPTSLAAKIGAALAVFAALLVAWELLHLRVGREVLASPADTIERLTSLFGTSLFWGHIQETMRALALAVLISCAAGTVVGTTLGLSALASAVTAPILVTLNSLPKVALYPVVLLFVGIGFGAKVLFGAMYGFIPMALIAMNAVRSMNGTLLRAGRSMRLSPIQTFGTIVIPAIIPEIVSGLRVSFSISLLGVLIGEMFASSRGLGFLIMNSININDTSTMLAATILIGGFALLGNTALLAAERAVARV